MTVVTADMLGPTPHPEFRGNGMGTASTSWLVKALVRVARDCELDQTAARWHDWAYAVGGRETDRQRFDELFWLNVRAQLRANWTGWRKGWKRLLLGRLLPWACYRAVTLFGRLAFEYEVEGDVDRELVLTAKARKFGYRYGPLADGG